MNIGLIIYGSLDTLSGGYLYNRKLVEYLRGQGDTVDIISLPWRNYAAHLTDNLWFRLWSPGARSRSRQQAVRLQKYDVLIQDELNHPSLIAANAGKHSYPIISLVHHLRCSELRPSWQNDFYRAIEKKYLRSVDGFIFNSETTKSVVSEIIDGEKKFVVAYPPTDRFGEMISEEEIIKRAKTPEFRILFLGNVIRRKGLHTVLKALKCQTLDIRLDIVGSLTSDRAYAQEMMRQVTVHHPSSTVHFHDSLDNQPLIELLKQSHLLVVPSSYEGFGIVYLEGMGFGLPAIGTTAGAAGEIISDGENGYLIQPDDANTLAKYLSDIATDRNLLIRLSVNALIRYRKQPKWEDTAKSIRDFLIQCVGADGRPPLPGK